MSWPRWQWRHPSTMARVRKSSSRTKRLSALSGTGIHVLSTADSSIWCLRLTYLSTSFHSPSIIIAITVWLPVLKIRVYFTVFALLSGVASPDVLEKQRLDWRFERWYSTTPFGHLFACRRHSTSYIASRAWIVNSTIRTIPLLMWHPCYGVDLRQSRISNDRERTKTWRARGVNEGFPSVRV